MVMLLVRADFSHLFLGNIARRWRVLLLLQLVLVGFRLGATRVSCTGIQFLYFYSTVLSKTIDKNKRKLISLHIKLNLF